MFVLAFCAGQAYSAPKGNNRKENKGNAKNVKVNKGNSQAVSQPKGRVAEHKQQARRTKEASQKREAKNLAVQRNSTDDNNELAFNARRANHGRLHDRKVKGEKAAPHAFGLIGALNQARWAHNPHDTRGQGNMGKPDMLDPFGHDKDSDRKELYVNNGRPIRVEEEPPPPEEPPLPEDPVLDAFVDFSSIESMEWLVDWYESVMAGYYTNEIAQANYTYDEWNDLWYDHFFPGGDLDLATGIRLNNIGDTTDRYDYDITLNDFEGDSVIVTTQMLIAEDYTASGQYYDWDTGTWVYYSADHLAGEVVYEETSEVTIDPETGLINVGIVATDDLIDSVSNEVYVNMIVTVTDPLTELTYTQTYDQLLYLYRCPYGKIKDSRTGQTIVGAKVTVHFEDGSIVALDKATNKTASNPQITDATGRFGFILQTNRKYYLTARAEGYEDYQSDVFTEQWHVLREDIKMASKPEQVASNID